MAKSKEKSLRVGIPVNAAEHEAIMTFFTSADREAARDIRRIALAYVGSEKVRRAIDAAVYEFYEGKA